jgi:hypothetical protein
MRLLQVPALLLTLATSPGVHAKAPRCSPPPAGGKGWPSTGVRVAPSDASSKRRIRLTRRDVLAIRCALERHMHTPAAARAVTRDHRVRVARWRMGAPSADGPRIGTFWVQLGDRDDEVVLRNTLALRENIRYGLSARLRRTKGGWRVVSFSDWHAHRRR